MKKILVVDDEKEIRELLAEKLKKNHYQALTASDGQEALKTAKLELPDLILLDVAMPVMDGYSTCEKLKQDNKTKDIKIVLLTGKDLEPQGMTKRYQQLGANGYLSKPSTLKELLDKIEEVLGEKGFGLIEILVVLVIVCILSYFGINSYFKKPTVDKATDQALKEQGINTTSYKSVLDSSRDKVKGINQQQADRQKLVDDLAK